MQEVVVSSKFQVAVPASVRRRLHIKQGDRLLVDVQGEHIVLLPKPENFAAALAGRHADVWAGVDPDEYIRRERDAWTG